MRGRGLFSLLLLAFLALGLSAWALDIPFFWLEKPTGRSNPFDPANPNHVPAVALPVAPLGTATITPTLGPSATATATPTWAPSSTRDVQVKYAAGTPLAGAVVMINNDTANVVVTGADGWAHLPLVSGKVDIHVFLPEISANYRTTWSYLGVALNPFRVILPDGSGTPTPTPVFSSGTAYVAVQVTFTGEASWFQGSDNGGMYNWAIAPCGPSTWPPLRTYLDGGIGTVIGTVHHYSAWESDCAGVTKTAVFLPPYTWVAGSQTVTAAVQATGFTSAGIALSASGYTPWNSQKRVYYNCGTGADHLWTGGYASMGINAAAFTYQVLFPDWASYHQLRIEASLTSGTRQAIFNRSLTYSAVPLTEAIQLPSDPRFSVLPSAASTTFTVQLENAFPINDGGVWVGQVAGGVTRHWIVYFDSSTYDLQMPLTLAMPTIPALAAGHAFVTGQTAIIEASFYERPGYDLFGALDTAPDLNAEYTYLIHDVFTW